MKKTILTLAMMLIVSMAALAASTVAASPASKTHVALKGDSIVINDGTDEVTVSGIPQKVRDKINKALDDTLTSGEGATVTIDGKDVALTPEDMKAMSDRWATVAENIGYASIWGLVALVLIILLFRYLTRRRKYHMVETAIENNYPLNDLALNEFKRSAIYVQQPVMPVAPQGQVPVGTPIAGTTPDNPIVTTTVNWRALMPAVKWLAWGIAIFLFGVLVAGGEDPFTPIGLALMFVGLCKGFILYNEQRSLQQALNRTQQQWPQQEPMREGIPVPPPMNRYNDDVSARD